MVCEYTITISIHIDPVRASYSRHDPEEPNHSFRAHSRFMLYHVRGKALE